jgi:hypothetical protein
LIERDIGMFRWILAWVGLVIAAAGCGPQVARKVNVYLPRNLPVSGAGLEASRKADTLVLAKCVRSEEYATTTAGDSVNSWYTTTWKVLQVERGRWPEETISFVFRDRWQLSKSGTALRTSAVPYYVGAIRAFYIDTRGRHTIVADEARSRIPPHGSVTRAEYDIDNPELRQLYERIANAARAFVQHEWGVTGPARVTEQYGRSFVVEIETPSDSAAVVVNGETMAVRWADPNDAER